MDDQQSGLRRAGKRLARRVLVDAWYSPVNLMVSSRGLVHIARHVLDELHNGPTSVLHASDRPADPTGSEGRLPAQE